MSESAADEEQRPLTVAEAAARPLPGSTLKAAREQLGMTVNDVAQSIKFSPRQIEALERDEYSQLPPGSTFIRGFIRSYAKLLRIESAPLLDALPQEAPVEPVELAQSEDIGTRMPVPGNRRAWMPFLALGALAVAVGALAVHYFYRGEVRSASRPNPAAGGETPAPAPAVLPAVQAPVAADTAAQPPLASPPAAIQPPAPAMPQVAAVVPERAAPAKAPVVAAEAPAAPVEHGKRHHHQLIFMFDGDAWVEVKDASERIIFSQLNSGGTRQVVNGSPPFDMVIGNASKVHLQYDGHAVDLAPDTRAEVARLTLQ